MTEGQQVSPQLWFMKQTIGNACGTIGGIHWCSSTDFLRVLHCLANNQDHLNLSSHSSLHKFFATTKSLTPLERAHQLVSTRDIAEAHTDASSKGQTKTPDLDADINLHFIAFVEKDNELYQL